MMFLLRSPRLAPSAVRYRYFFEREVNVSTLDLDGSDLKP